MSSSAGASAPTAEDWDTHKETIRTLFFGEDGPGTKVSSYQDILEFLESQGINANESQLEYRLRKWKFRRNLPKKASLYISHMVAKRKNQGKESEVLLCDKKLDLVKIRGKINRSKSVSLINKYYGAPSPEAPEGLPLVIRTPEASPNSPTLLRPFPWRQFQSEYMENITSMFSPTAGPIHGLLVSNFDYSRLEVIYESQLATMNENIVPLELAKHLHQAIPLDTDEENMRRTAVLLRGGLTSYGFDEVLKAFFFLVSNNFYDFNRRDSWDAIKSILQPGITKSVIPLSPSWRRSITISTILEKLFQCSLLWAARGDDEALVIVRWLLNSGQSPNQHGNYGYPNPNVNHPLMVAISTKRVGLVKMLLEFGADANTDSKRDCDAPLAAACRVLPIEVSKELVSLLLLHGARPNQVGGSTGMPALNYAVRNANIMVIGLLLEYGADIWHRHVNLNDDMEHTDYMCHTTTALSEAAGLLTRRDAIEKNTGETSLSLVQFLLGKLSPPINLNALVDADVLIAAALSGNDAVITLLSSLGACLESWNEFYITPLCAAANNGHVSTCKLLLRLGVSVSLPTLGTPSALHLAAFNNRPQIIKLLAQYNASPNSSIDASSPGYQTCQDLFVVDCGDDCQEICCSDVSDKDKLYDGELQLVNHYRTPFLSALTERNISCAILLLRMGATLSTEELFLVLATDNLTLFTKVLEAGLSFDKHIHRGLSALQFALSKCDASIVEKLLLQRVQLRGGELAQAFKLGNLRLIEMLLIQGAISGPSPFGETFLEAAACSKKKDVVHLALQMRPNVYDSGALCAAVFNACQEKDYSIVSILLGRRPLALQSDSLEATAVSIAVFFRNTYLVQVLTTWLPTASQGRIPAQIQTIYEHDAWFRELRWIRTSKIDPLNMKGAPFWKGTEFIVASPLMVAVYCKEDILMTRLVEVGYQPDWMTISYAIFTKSKFTTPLLASHAVLPSIATAQGILPPPAYWAVNADDAAVLRLLQVIEKDICATPRQRDLVRERTVFQLAVERGNDEIVSLLIEAGADVNEPPGSFGGATALQLAAIKGHFGIANRLIALGADVDAPGAGYAGRTAIEAAAEHGRVDVLQLLLNHCNKNKDAWSGELLRAAFGAYTQGHHTIVRTLEEERGWTVVEEKKFQQMVKHSSFRVDWEVDSERE